LSSTSRSGVFRSREEAALAVRVDDPARAQFDRGAEKRDCPISYAQILAHLGPQPAGGVQASPALHELVPVDEEDGR
jgi:hypothetical protein